MKLNLLPTYVSKEKQTRTATVVSVLIGIIGIALAFFLISKSSRDLQDAKAAADVPDPDARLALQRSLEADAVIESARMIIRDINLAQAMQAHNAVYPDLYNKVMPYIPRFFRVNSISAAPNGPDSATVTIQGTIKTYQQYADLMLALLRIPDAKAVSRNGFTNIDPYVPGLQPQDQVGKPHRPNDAPIPDDPLARLNQKIGDGRMTGFLGQSNFGAEGDDVRGAMPGYSLVTVTVVLPLNIQTPNPRATLAASATGAAGGAQGFGSPGNTAPAPKATPPPATDKGRKGGRKLPVDEEG